MKRSVGDLAFATALLYLIVIITIVPASGSDLDKWKVIIDNGSKGTVFDKVDASTPPWPAVHSAEYISALKDANRQEQAEFLSIAHAILHDAKIFLNEKANHSPAENWRTIESVLSLRDSILSHTGYANFVLAESLNRVGFVFLCQDLRSEKQVSPEFEKSLSHLMKYQVSDDQWVAITMEELGWAREKFKEIVDNPEVGLNKLWDLISNNDNFVFPKNIIHVCSDDLLKQRDLSILLYRYIHSDLVIKRLSLAAQYKKQTPDFSLDDRSEKIAKVLPGSGDGEKMSLVVTGGVPRVVFTKPPLDKTNLSMGERFVNMRSSPDDVATLLQVIKSGQTDKFLLFYREDILLPPKTRKPQKRAADGLHLQVAPLFTRPVVIGCD